MTIYESLSAQFHQWSFAQNEYERTASVLMVQFAEGFREYLGLSDESTSSEIVKLDKIDETQCGIASHIPVDNSFDALSYDSEGAWRFGIALNIGHPQNWVNIYFDIRFTLGEHECEFQNALERTRRFPCKLGEPRNLGDAYDYF